MRWPERLVVALLLALAFAVLHHGALGVGWTFDDPAHLHFAATHSPWQYFTQREVMLRQSYAHITPWNILFYDLGLPWAGLDSRKHHLHLLAVLWAVAVATWALMRRWLSPAAALAGALLFAVMPSTAVVGHMLMTGHYAYGLLFSVFAIHAWAIALAQPAGKGGRSLRYACLAALLYALACLCKELYAPLPAVLLCMPATGRSAVRRLVLLLPIGAVAVAYAALRLWLFGGLGVGGHAMLAINPAPAADIPAMLGQFRVLLWGMGASGWAALTASLALVGLGWRGAGRAVIVPSGRALFLLTGCVIALLLPLASLAKAGELGYGHHRLTLGLGWALAVGLAWQLRQAGRAGAALVLVLAVLLVMGQRHATAFVDTHSRPLARHYEFLLHGTGADRLIPRNFERVGYLRDMAATIQKRTGRAAPMIVGDEDQVVALGAQAGARVHAWAEDCACLRALGAQAYAERVQSYREGLARGAGQALALELSLIDAGSRKALRWKLAGQPGAAKVWLDMPDVGRLNISQEGQFAFGVDNTLPLPNPLGLRFAVETATGALIRTPLLYMPLTGASTLRWDAGGEVQAAPPPPITSGG